MIIKCPSDCEHEDYDFPHSLIVKVRSVKVGKELIQFLYVFVVCRFCGHWICRDVRNCACPYFCHDKKGGLVIAQTDTDTVD